MENSFNVSLFHPYSVKAINAVDQFMAPVKLNLKLPNFVEEIIQYNKFDSLKVAIFGLPHYWSDSDGQRQAGHNVD